MRYYLPKQKEQAIKAIETAKDGYYCDVGKVKKNRSLSQNRYYHGVVVKMFSIEFGWFTNETHHLFGKKFLSYEKNGEEFIRSTSDLDTIEFENFLSQCRVYAAEGGLYIPVPNEVTEELINQLEGWRFE